MSRVWRFQNQNIETSVSDDFQRSVKEENIILKNPVLQWSLQGRCEVIKIIVLNAESTAVDDQNESKREAGSL